MYRRGIVDELDANEHRVRVRFPDRQNVQSPWLDVLVRDTSKNKDYALPSIGAQVAVLMDEEDTSGCVLGALYSKADKPIATSAKVRRVDFESGGFIEYNDEGGGFRIKIDGLTIIGESGDEFVALANLVDARFATVKTAHDTHAHPTGVGPSGPPAAPMPALESVACTKLKAV